MTSLKQQYKEFVFDYYSVINNWHWRLLVLIFGIYFRSGFGDDWNFTGDLQVLLFWDRSDRRVSRCQTGTARGLTGRRCVGFDFRLFVWISMIVS